MLGVSTYFLVPGHLRTSTEKQFASLRLVPAGAANLGIALISKVMPRALNVIGALLRVVGALRSLENIEELPLDGNNHLANHWLLIPLSCRERLGVPEREAIPERELAFVVGSSPLGKMFFSSDSCETPAAIALERGTHRNHIQHHFERFEYPQPIDADDGLEMRRLRSNFQRWLQSRAIVEGKIKSASFNTEFA